MISTTKTISWIRCVAIFNSIALLLILLVACDGENDTTSTSLQGRWLNCYSPELGSGVEIVFHGASWTVYSNAYADINCETRTDFELVEQGEFSIGEEVLTESGVVARKIDLTARFGNIDMYRAYFDMFYIEHDRLYFGIKTTNELTLLENRPRDVDYSYSFKRA